MAGWLLDDCRNVVAVAEGEGEVSGIVVKTWVEE
jgi:hypothetical protein